MDDRQLDVAALAESHLTAIRATRRAASRGMALGFAYEATERAVANRWADELANTPEIAGCWYVPPPRGVAVLAGADRLASPSFRPESAWPSDRRVDIQEPCYGYASPTHRSGIIGDFGATLYAGEDLRLRDHIRQVLAVTYGLAGLAAPGVSLAALASHARHRFADLGLVNDIASITDPTGTNIGHTIPFFATAQSPINQLDEPACANISTARVFVNEYVPDVITENFAFTIEPRLAAPGLPPVSFHVVVAVVDGSPQVVTEFEPVFAWAQMGWLDLPW